MDAVEKPCLGGACCMPVRTPEDAQRLLPWQYNRGVNPVAQSQGCSDAFSQQQMHPVTEGSLAFASEPQEASNPIGLGTNSMMYAADMGQHDLSSIFDTSTPLATAAAHLPFSREDLERVFPVIPKACSGPRCCNPPAETGSDSQDDASISAADAATVDHVKSSGCKPATMPFKGKQNGTSKPPSASSLAQRRYQQRQKEKQKDALQQLEEIKEKVELLLYEKKELEVQGRMLQQNLQGFHEHLEALSVDEVVQELQQTEALRQLALIMGRVSGRVFSTETVKRWTLKEYVGVHFQGFMDRQAALSQEVLHNPTSTACNELYLLVEAYRAVCQRTGLSSCLHYGVLAYNLEETERCKHAAPGPEAWARLVESLELSGQQEQGLLEAWRLLHKMLVPLSQQRSRLLSQLGVEAMSFPWDQMHKAPAADEMRSSFQDEQNAVLGFFIGADKVLSTAQAALLDSRAYPWCPEWAPMLQSLQRRRGEQVLELPDMSVQKMRHCPLLPQVTAVESLTRTMTCKGIGMRLRHGLILYPFEVALQQSCFPPTTQRSLQDQTLMQIMMCEWLDTPCWKWMRQVKDADRTLPNRLREHNA